MVVPLETRTPESPAEDPNDFDRLKTILFGDERGTLEALDARVERIESAQQDLPSRLPGAIERAQQGVGAARMSKALAKPVTDALGSAVEQNRQLIVDVLFPVIGPAIRKAIAEALRNLVADLNGAIESSLTPRGIRWRIEAWRSGVPYAEIVLKHTLKYGIDHVFLIERGSGLVLDRESAPHLAELDADAIAGMLTAIGEFVRDSVGRDGSGTLDSARVGEHLLWVVQGPRANLACFIHGVPPAKLHAVLERRLEAIHAALADGHDAADEATRQSLHPDVLMRDARVAVSAPSARSRWPAYVIAFVAVAVVAWVIAQRIRDDAWVEQVRSTLATHPGFVTTRIERSGGALNVHGLLDPDAEPLDATALAGERAPMSLKLDTVGYVSTEDAIVARRAKRLLDAPPGVTIEAHDGALTLAGRATAAWVDGARERAAWVPGVRRVEFNVAREDDAVAAARAALAEIVRAMPEKRVAFVRETEPSAESPATLDAIVADAGRAATLAATAGVPLQWIATGTNDDPGSDATNARVRGARAQWLADALRARGITNVAIAPDDDATARETRQRGAFLRSATP
ncbi:MAG TPA: hypothetical protein VFV97_01815 [Rhodanobacteraceae bacterium]|nr:hypothetical protein [Rhodanobacteraceae bacterium]